MATLTSQLLIRLIDGVSGPARVAVAGLRTIQTAARGMSTGFAATQMRLGAALEANNAKLAAMRGRMFEAAAGAWALERALSPTFKTAMDFETVLEDLGQKADMSGERLTAVGKRIREIGRQTNQGALSVAKGIDFLVGMGLGGKTDQENVDNALAMAPAIGKATTAFRANFEEMAKSAHAIFFNLKTPANEVERAIDAMAMAGQQGGFELKDMAKSFSQITATAQFFGEHGVPAVADLAAALQVARTGAQDGEAAANNMMNFFQKLTLKETIKNFKKFGIDVTRELKFAREKGLSPIEHILNVLRKATKGDADLISQIFGDKQVLEFIRPMWEGMKRYQEIRQAALDAQGYTERNFQRRLETSEEKLKRFTVGLENLRISLGNALLPGLTAITDALGPIVRRIEAWVEANPKLAASIVAVTAGLIGLRIAALGVAFAGGLAYSGLLMMARGGLAVVGFLARLTVAPILAMLSPLAALRAAFIGLAVITPVGAAVAAIAAAGVAIYNNWSGIKAMFGGIAEGFMAGLGPLPGLLQPIADMAHNIFTWFSGLVGPIKASNEEWAAFGRTIGGTVAAGINAAISAIGTFVGWLKSAWQAAVSLGQAIRNMGSGGGSTAGPDPMAPKPPGQRWKPRISGSRAGGGPVTAGRSYLVGEKRPEIFTPSTSGRIHANAGSPVTVTMNNTFSISGVSDPREVIERIGDHLERRIEQAVRGLQADTGLRFT